jgi:hypothetical protein
MNLIRLPFCLMVPIIAQAQWISVGIMGGVPASTWSHQSPPGCLDTRTPICGPNDFLTRPYAVGPALDVNLPLGLSAEAGLLYQNFHQDITTGLIVGRGGSVNFGQRAGVSANGWLFPTLLKYHFGHSTVVPFVDAGVTLRHLGAFDGNGVQVDSNLIPQPAVFHIESGRALDAAITVGGGVRWRLLWLDIEPQLRYLHWTSAYYQPAQNEAMLMVGILFPARRH